MVSADDIIQDRRARTSAVLENVRIALLEELGPEANEVFGTKVTVYATGSCGRGDMGAASDLDPYVVSLGELAPGQSSNSVSTVIAGALERAVERAELPELDADGEYARLVSASSLFDKLGSPEDDKSGSLTRRMLLLLESRALVNAGAYDDLIKLAIDAYWKNSEEHREDYLPIILVNDIVRYWRIVLLNHESRLRDKIKKASLSPEDEMALRRYGSYKLRVPRCLTCFSALAYLLALTPTEPAHVERDDIFRMAHMNPMERLDHLRGKSMASIDTLEALRGLYVRFLERTNGGKTALTDALKVDPQVVRAVSREGREFTRQMFCLIQELGGGRPLHRAIVV